MSTQPKPVASRRLISSSSLLACALLTVWARSDTVTGTPSLAEESLDTDGDDVAWPDLFKPVTPPAPGLRGS